MGIVGVGHMGQYHLNVVHSLLSTHTLVGLFDTDNERAGKLAEKFNTRAYDKLEDLLSECDAVTIAVPTELHHKTALLAFEHDCHVLLEKPVTEVVSEAEELFELAAGKNLVLQVGHVERFNGAVQELNKIVENPLFIESRRMGPNHSRIRGVGVVLDLMIHDIDIVVNLVDSPVIGISAFGQKVVSDHEDIASVLIQFESGCVANISASRVTQQKVRTLAISQDKNYIFLNYADQDIDIYRQAHSAYLMTKDQIKYSQESFVEKVYIHKDNPLKLQHMHFAQVIAGKAEPIVKPEADLRILRIANEIRNQIETGQKDAVAFQ